MSNLPIPIYFESHITTEPVFGEELTRFCSLCEKHDFKPATLLLQKRKEDTPTRSSKDAFCTGRSKDYESLKQKMDCLSEELQQNGFMVWRKKIEAVLLDIKTQKKENVSNDNKEAK